jgi:hypothetical protein
VRRRLLDEVIAHRGVLTGGDVPLSVLQHGSNAAAKNLRDVTSLYCLFVLFSDILKRESDDTLSSIAFGVRNASDVIDYSQQCLLRCWKIYLTKQSQQNDWLA